MDALFTSSGLLALVTLTFLEIVLGVDNVIFISILQRRWSEIRRPALEARRPRHPACEFADPAWDHSKKPMVIVPQFRFRHLRELDRKRRLYRFVGNPIHGLCTGMLRQQFESRNLRC